VLEQSKMMKGKVTNLF